MTDAETIIIGGGVMGAAAAYALSRRGRDVLLIEQFDIGHDRGSSHGQSRILRFAYFEHPDYARLAMASAPMWRNIESQAGVELMRRCGGIDIGPPDGLLAAGSLRACRDLSLPHELLDAGAIGRRFPFVPNDGDAGVYQPDACILAATQCVLALARLAAANGARLLEKTTIHSITATANRVVAETSSGPMTAQRAIVTAGPWTRRLLADLNLPLRVIRKHSAFHEPPDPSAYSPGAFPIFIHQTGESFYYGLPIFGHTGVKVGDHAGDDEVDPDNVDRTFRPDDEAHIRTFLRRHLPDLDRPAVDHQVCLYTLTPDSDFIIDRHPRHNNVVIAAGFSGHGFKFAPVVGEILADLSGTGRTNHPIDRFRIARFS